jgi:hypothetical protein
MGIGRKYSVSGRRKSGSPSNVSRIRLGEPQAHRFEILSMEQIGSNVVGIFRYPDATEFKGIKIVVYRDVTVQKVAASSKLDPHFLKKSSHPTPFARFVPSSDGHRAARELAKLLLTCHSRSNYDGCFERKYLTD